MSMIHIDYIPIISGLIPQDDKSDDKEFNCGLSNPHDLGDDEDPEDGCRPSGARPTDPLERFVRELDDPAILNSPDIKCIWEIKY